MDCSIAPIAVRAVVRRLLRRRWLLRMLLPSRKGIGPFQKWSEAVSQRIQRAFTHLFIPSRGVLDPKERRLAVGARKKARALKSSKDT